MAVAANSRLIVSRLFFMVYVLALRDPVYGPQRIQARRSIRPDGSAKDGELFHANGKIYAFSKMWDGKNWHRAVNLLKEKYLQSNTEFSPPSGNKLSFPFGVT
jgi:hypothetical protein